MISYEPLWRTMKEKKATTYTLRNRGEGEYSIWSGTYKRLKEGKSVSTNTLDILCKILDCRLEDIAEYVPD